MVPTLVTWTHTKIYQNGIGEDLQINGLCGSQLSMFWNDNLYYFKYSDSDPTLGDETFCLTFAKSPIFIVIAMGILHRMHPDCRGLDSIVATGFPMRN